MRYWQWIALLVAVSSVFASMDVEASGAGKKRPGCGKFCQQAGGFGGDETDVVPVVVPKQKLGGTRDRIVEISATCTLTSDCIGAILLTGKKFEYGRADLDIPAGQTLYISVGISKKAKQWLTEHGNDKKAFATVPLLDGTQPVSVSKNLTVLAP